MRWTDQGWSRVSSENISCEAWLGDQRHGPKDQSIQMNRAGSTKGRSLCFLLTYDNYLPELFRLRCRTPQRHSKILLWFHIVNDPLYIASVENKRLFYESILLQSARNGNENDLLNSYHLSHERKEMLSSWRSPHSPSSKRWPGVRVEFLGQDLHCIVDVCCPIPFFRITCACISLLLWGLTSMQQRLQSSRDDHRLGEDCVRVVALMRLILPWRWGKFLRARKATRHRMQTESGSLLGLGPYKYLLSNWTKHQVQSRCETIQRLALSLILRLDMLSLLSWCVSSSREVYQAMMVSKLFFPLSLVHSHFADFWTVKWLHVISGSSEALLDEESSISIYADSRSTSRVLFESSSQSHRSETDLCRCTEKSDARNFNCPKGQTSNIHKHRTWWWTFAHLYHFEERDLHLPYYALHQRGCRSKKICAARRLFGSDLRCPLVQVNDLFIIDLLRTQLSRGRWIRAITDGQMPWSFTMDVAIIDVGWTNSFKNATSTCKIQSKPFLTLKASPLPRVQTSWTHHLCKSTLSSSKTTPLFSFRMDSRTRFRYQESKSISCHF